MHVHVHKLRLCFRTTCAGAVDPAPDRDRPRLLSIGKAIAGRVGLLDFARILLTHESVADADMRERGSHVRLWPTVWVVVHFYTVNLSTIKWWWSSIT